MNPTPNSMKRFALPIAVFAILLSVPSTAEQICLGTNLVTVLFEDQSLSGADRAFIAEEWRRALDPACELFPPTAGETDYEIWESKAEMPPLPALINTNESPTVVFSVSESTAWLAAKPVCEASATAVSRLDAFVTNQLTGSTIMNASDTELARLIITKEWAPGNPPELATGQTFIRDEWFDGFFFLPPRFTLAWLDAGLSNPSTNLWALIPVSRNGKVSEIPAVYFNGQWYLSQWFSEVGEKCW